MNHKSTNNYETVKQLNNKKLSGKKFKQSRFLDYVKAFDQ